MNKTNKTIALNMFRELMKAAIKCGMFTFNRKPYVIITSKEHTDLINKARSYDRIKEFVNS